MTNTILKHEIRTARKVYPCDAYQWWHNAGMREQDCKSDDERCFLSSAEADRGKILRGQPYLYQRGVFEGRMYTWRARVGMQALCVRHDLFED